MSDSYKTSLVIVEEGGRVVARRHSTGFSLPEVEVEPGRVGISLSRAVCDQLQLETFSLVLPPRAGGPLHILRLQRPDAALPPGYVWTSTTNLPEHEIVQDALTHFSSVDTAFARYAWYTKVSEWIADHIVRLGHTCCRLEQWNGRVGGVLLRVLTDGPDFWFKAVSDFNAREFSIAQLLSDRHPTYFPRVLAAEPNWNAFLLENVCGEELNDRVDLGVWEQVAELLADVQMSWIGESSRLIAAGAADLRPSALLKKIPWFLEQVAETMARQTKTSPAILNKDDLADLGEQLEMLCAEISILPFSEGLANADFSPHNTLITPNGPIFIDWAEACVSFPLIVGEYMWNRMVIEAPDRKRWQEALRKAYLQRWAQNYGGAVVKGAAELMPAFAVFALLVFLHEREGHGPSRYDAYLRSLARRLKQEVDRLHFANYTRELKEGLIYGR
jgi:hypothetical protein